MIEPTAQSARQLPGAGIELSLAHKKPAPELAALSVGSVASQHAGMAHAALGFGRILSSLAAGMSLPNELRRAKQLAVANDQRAPCTKTILA